MPDKALWRRAYDAVERPVGSRLEVAVQTDTFADAAGLMLRARAGIARQVERTTRHALHRVNLPAASDVARLREQIGELNRDGPSARGRPAGRTGTGSRRRHGWQ